MQFERIDWEITIGLFFGYFVGLLGALVILGIPCCGKDYLGLNYIAMIGAFSGAMIGFLDDVVHRSLEPVIL